MVSLGGWTCQAQLCGPRIERQWQLSHKNLTFRSVTTRSVTKRWCKDFTCLTCKSLTDDLVNHEFAVTHEGKQARQDPNLVSKQSRGAGNMVDVVADMLSLGFAHYVIVCTC